MSKKWSNKLKEEVEQLGGYKAEGDGIFYTDVETYYDNFKKTSINLDTSTWHLDYFLKLDDQSTSLVRL